ncbi:hypothetical protein IAR50_003191 [Cryptococcus sp. DSM 104548]
MGNMGLYKARVNRSSGALERALRYQPSSRNVASTLRPAVLDQVSLSHASSSITSSSSNSVSEYESAASDSIITRFFSRPKPSRYIPGFGSTDSDSTFISPSSSSSSFGSASDDEFAASDSTFTALSWSSASYMDDDEDVEMEDVDLTLCPSLTRTGHHAITQPTPLSTVLDPHPPPTPPSSDQTTLPSLHPSPLSWATYLPSPRASADDGISATTEEDSSDDDGYLGGGQKLMNISTRRTLTPRASPPSLPMSPQASLRYRGTNGRNRRVGMGMKMSMGGLRTKNGWKTLRRGDRLPGSRTCLQTMMTSRPDRVKSHTQTHDKAGLEEVDPNASYKQQEEANQ